MLIVRDLSFWITAKSSSVSNGIYSFRFPRSGIPQEGYFKVASLFLRGAVPAAAYLQVRSEEMGNATFAICADNEFDFRTKVIAITPCTQNYADARQIWRKYTDLQTNLMTLYVSTADGSIITDGWCAQSEFKPLR
jgi:hypothetical protein